MERAQHYTGYIPPEKPRGCIRGLYVNPHRFNTIYTLKTQQLLRCCQNISIDIVQLADTATRWTTRKSNKLAFTMNKYKSNSKIVTSDSSLPARTAAKEHLPGGTATILFHPVANWSQSSSHYIDPLGRWTAITLCIKEFSILLITLYCIPNTTNYGPLTSMAQYNTKTGIIQTSSFYRFQILNNISNYIDSRTDINDVILTGYFNQPIHQQ